MSVTNSNQGYTARNTFPSHAAETQEACFKGDPNSLDVWGTECTGVCRTLHWAFL